jgi:hypothetical protein
MWLEDGGAVTPLAEVPAIGRDVASDESAAPSWSPDPHATNTHNVPNRSSPLPVAIFRPSHDVSHIAPAEAATVAPHSINRTSLRHAPRQHPSPTCRAKGTPDGERAGDRGLSAATYSAVLLGHRVRVFGALAGWRDGAHHVPICARCGILKRPGSDGGSGERRSGRHVLCAQAASRSCRPRVEYPLGRCGPSRRSARDR